MTMELTWGASWGCGLFLILLTTAAHALGIVMLFRGLQQSSHFAVSHQWHIRFPIVFAVAIIGIVVLLEAILHGMEAGVWAVAYLWLGAIDSYAHAVLYSVDSFTTRGESGLSLAPQWRLMGALEAANGMLLFGISTAFVFAVMQRILTVMYGFDDSHRRGD
jgi:hypothetical protein